MPASLPPPRPPNPRAERRVNELLLGLLLVPMLAHGAQLVVRMQGAASFASSRGALAMLAGPTLAGVGLLLLTRVFWAAWAAWVIDVLLLGIVGAGDVIVAHAFPARLLVAGVLLPLLAWRIAGLQRMQRELSPPTARG